MNEIMFLLGVYGAVNLSMYNGLTKWIVKKLGGTCECGLCLPAWKRFLKTLLTCPMCQGFWIGLALSLWILPVPHPVICACAASGASYFLNRLVNDDGLRVTKTNQ